MEEFFIYKWQSIHIFGALVLAIIIFGCLGFSLWKALMHPESSAYWHIVSGITLFGTLLVGVFITRVNISAIALYCSLGVLTLGIIGTFIGIMAIAIHRVILYKN